MNQEDRRLYEEEMHIASKGFDNIIFVVATGTFGLSLTFLTGLSTTYLINPGLLICSWISLSFALLFHSFAYRMSFRHGELGMEGEEDRTDGTWGRREWAYHLSMGTNWLAFGTLVLGVIFLTSFASTNFLRANEIRKQAPPSSATSTPLLNKG